MKAVLSRSLLALTIAALIAPPVYAWQNPFDLTTEPNGEVEMHQRYNYDPMQRYRGTQENDGSVHMRNYNGDTLRGTIDEDGYGRLRDDNGNSWRVRPR
jgi:hypothetical protein